MQDASQPPAQTQQKPQADKKEVLTGTAGLAALFVESIDQQLAQLTAMKKRMKEFEKANKSHDRDTVIKEAKLKKESDKVKKEKKEKKEKKPRKLSAYNLFLMEKQPILKEQGVAQVDMMKTTGAEWKTMSDADKDKYQEMAKKHNLEKGLLEDSTKAQAASEASVLMGGSPVKPSSSSSATAANGTSGGEATATAADNKKKRKKEKEAEKEAETEKKAEVVDKDKKVAKKTKKEAAALPPPPPPPRRSRLPTKTATATRIRATRSRD